ncbi:TetR family transcriptional regulator [Saccharopolyspora oryzae]|uniref:TetR family transcriptional regulator n=1 Tax=Saccharopolyspora oryzae TaxID=2997343 RepID=A0ABT4UZH3_9PSEU|nr:TetR family transcriptional regulator [Saccharopolyspora oryzae]MDA3627103.1 TetR family transcriptional regulator [Saccharopolyspora oryzae]
MAGLTYGTGRQALLDAAVRVVAAQGLRGLTYRSVAAEAGVTHGSVRYHFGDWETLVQEALAHCVKRSVEDGDLSSPGEDFEEFASGLISLVAADPDAQAFQYELYMEARRRPELRPVMERANGLYREAVGAELARHGLDDPDLAELVFVTLDGLVFHQTVFGDSDRTERAAAALRNLLETYRTAKGT